jgi:putative endonuclease
MSTAERDSNQSVGRMGEQFVAEYLERTLGWNVIERNWRCSAGELDLIARDGQTTVMVEVKTRKGIRMGHPLEAVDGRKRRQLTRLANWYQASKVSVVDGSVRVDVVGLLVQGQLVHGFWHIRDALVL